VVTYLRDLGVSDCYSSPVLKAKPGSPHGYDICDHGRLNPELGGEEGFEAFAGALREAGMGLVLDTVPNHMGIAHPSNGWWMDVLENGPTSIYASYFDIDWRPVNPALENKVLLPFLGDQYGAVLEGGQIRLAYDNGAFFLHYFDFKWPVAPRAYALVLGDRLEELSARLGAEHDHVLELRSILTALNYLPTRPDLPPEKMIERNREKEVIKRRIAALAGASPEVRAAIDSTVRAFNGSVGDGRSFDRLDELLGLQAYRPAYWRVATEEINYRRFFDINELAAIRTELPEVFAATHQLLFRLLAEGKVTGLRIDHPDGLRDPTSYFLRLQENYLLHRARALGGPGRNWQGLEEAVRERLAGCVARAEEGPVGWPLYVVAEKILGENEPLPHDWAVDGTTGYDFLNAVNGLFVDRSHAEAFTALYHQFTGKRFDFGAMLISTQRLILRESMTSELNALGHELDRISERNRRYRDFTLNSLTLGIREVIAGLVIYRTYISDPERGVALRDRRFIEEAVETARDENPRVASSVLDFIRDTLLLRNLGDFREEDRPRVLNWVLKFQQLTGPVLAKALEDTVFYQYNRLASLNEVGGHPERFGVTVAEFHRENLERAALWPHAMLATSTHDTKRSEDVRARIDVLSEVPEEWELALKRWAHLNAAKKGIVENRPSPDRNDE
jgi:(1->4)-alpha-D-glucan 1-alpha-D-glucosylmutase